MSYFKRALKRGREGKRLYRYFRISKQNPYEIKIIQERIGLHETSQFLKELSDYLDRHRGSTTINCSRVDNLDYAGIAVIVQEEARARKRGIYLRLEGLHGRARDLTDITRTTGILEHPERYLAYPR